MHFLVTGGHHCHYLVALMPLGLPTLGLCVLCLQVDFASTLHTNTNKLCCKKNPPPSKEALLAPQALIGS